MSPNNTSRAQSRRPNDPEDEDEGMAAPADDGTYPEDDGADDLAGIELDKLDLEQIEVEGAGEEGPFRLGRLLLLLVLLAAGAFTLWLPNSEWYQIYGQSNVAFFGICAAGIIIGVGVARILWQYVQELAARLEVAPTEPAGPPKPPSALRRWLTFAITVTGGAAIVFGVPASAYYSDGDAYHSGWFLAAGGAVVVGVLAGRWLLMQANAAVVDDKPREPIKLPPWFKWVTLSVLLAGGLFAIIGSVFFASDTQTGNFEFAVGVVAFVVGVAGAIWLVRRFDELEKKHQQKQAASGAAATALGRRER